MRIVLALGLTCLCIVTTPTAFANGRPLNNEEKKTLEMVLRTYGTSGDYVIVQGSTVWEESNRAGVKQAFRDQGLEIDALVDRLFVVNQGGGVPIDLESDRAKGYVIDTHNELKEHELSKFYWGSFHRSHPDAHAAVMVSRPVFDEGSGLVLVYEAEESVNTSAVGRIFAYQLDSGRLTQVGAVDLWRL